MRLVWRLDALDKWRDEVDRWRVRTDDVLGALTTADEIAKAVAEKMSSTRELHFTKVQQTIAIMAVIAAYASPFIAWRLGS